LGARKAALNLMKHSLIGHHSNDRGLSVNKKQSETFFLACLHFGSEKCKGCWNLGFRPNQALIIDKKLSGIFGLVNFQSKLWRISSENGLSTFNH